MHFYTSFYITYLFVCLFIYWSHLHWDFSVVVFSQQWVQVIITLCFQPPCRHVSFPL